MFSRTEESRFEECARGRFAKPEFVHGRETGGEVLDKRARGRGDVVDLQKVRPGDQPPECAHFLLRRDVRIEREQTCAQYPGRLPAHRGWQASPRMPECFGIDQDRLRSVRDEIGGMQIDGAQHVGEVNDRSGAKIVSRCFARIPNGFCRHRSHPAVIPISDERDGFECLGETTSVHPFKKAKPSGFAVSRARLVKPAGAIREMHFQDSASAMVRVGAIELDMAHGKLRVPGE